MVEMPEDDVPRGVNKMVVGAGIALLAVAIIGVFLVFRFIESERVRELQQWQIRMGIVADSRTAAVKEWVELQFSTMRELADNASLQLYMTELSLLGDAASSDDSGETGYLRNLLVATAERTGFSQPPDRSEVAANIERAGLAGIALTDRTGKVLVATPTMPPIAGRLKEFVENVPPGERGLLDMFLAPNDQPAMAFLMPVYGVQSNRRASEVIGMVVGVRLIGPDLFSRLAQPGETEKTGDSYLVRRNGPNVDFLSPLRDGTPPLRRSLALDTPNLAPAYVLQNAGGFGIRTAHDNQEVLVTGRPVAATPWVLVRQVTRAEALAPAESRQTTMLIVFLLVIVITSVVIVAVWRHGTSVRATAAAERFRIAAERFQNLGKFLRVVSDSQPAEVVAVTDKGVYTFANKTAADAVKLAPEDMIGKTMAQVLGPARAKIFEDLNKGIIARTEEIIAAGKRIQHIHTFRNEDGTGNLVRSTHFPLRGDRDHPPAVLMILDDITDLMTERERRERIFQELIEMLVNIVGQRDPYSADHATRVSQVAGTIAREMALNENEVRSIEIAGQLMNLGKTFVPQELLTREGPLTSDELQVVREAMLRGADLLNDVEFDGPVPDIIRQAQENVDGTGRPEQLKGEDILVGARVLAVANAFVAMVRPRSYRKEGMTFEQAADALGSQAGKMFDRKAVFALLNALENREGKQQWRRFDLPDAAQ